MNKPLKFNPYFGNILIDPLAPILDRSQITTHITYLPPRLTDIHDMPRHIRRHHLLRLRDLHLGSLEGARAYESMDMMIRDGYRYKDPSLPQSWSLVSGEMGLNISKASAMAMAVVGHSGTGKSQTISRAFNILCPRQVIEHATFPKIVGKHYQLSWLSVDVPSSGQACDLAFNLMDTFDSIMQMHVPDWERRFQNTHNRKGSDGQKMLDEWRQVALIHFLGMLHLDEVQNFFKPPALRNRRSQKSLEDNFQLSIIEDKCLKWLLTLTNTWQIPLLISGTPDGVGAFMKRFANTQRFVNGGFHVLPRFKTVDDPLFFNPLGGGFLNTLGLYQYVDKPLKISTEFATYILELTAGIPRLIIALWIAAHRVAFERKEDSLQKSDFTTASDTFLAPVKPAVQALLSNDPRQVSRFDDLMKHDDNFWSSFWAQM